MSRNYSKALEQIDEHLAFFPQRLIHRNKQRLTKIHQYLLRMRKLKLKGTKPKLVSINRKIDQREERREVKALKAANVERTIEQELVDRLAKGTYGDIYNFPEVQYQKALEKVATEESESETEDPEMEIEDEDDISESGLVEYVEDLEDDDDLSDVEDFEFGDSDDSEDDSEQESSSDDDDNDIDVDKKSKKRTANPKKKPPKKIKRHSKKPQVEIEYEEETDENDPQVAVGLSW